MRGLFWALEDLRLSEIRLFGWLSQTCIVMIDAKQPIGLRHASSEASSLPAKLWQCNPWLKTLEWQEPRPQSAWDCERSSIIALYLRLKASVVRLVFYDRHKMTMAAHGKTAMALHLHFGDTIRERML